MSHTVKDRVTVALTGASGAQYGLRLIGVLLSKGIPVNVLLSKAALVVLAMELDISLGSNPSEQKRRLLTLFNCEDALLYVYGIEDWSAPIASGSNPAKATIICPCTSGTLAAIATGQSNNLIERCADVSLKERKPLIMVLRETPLSLIHIENMATLTKAGAVIMPASPGFYNKPKTVEALIDFMVARILDQIHIEHDLMEKWGDHKKEIK